MNKLKLWAIIAIMFLVVGLMGCTQKVATTTKPMNSKDAKDTQVTSILQIKIPKQENLIYCTTFQLAWNELKNEIIKEPIQLEKQSPEANYLNQEITSKKDLSSKDYVAMAGFSGEGTVKRINQELISKFGPEAKQLEDRYPANNILAYAYLNKQLKFKQEFEALEKGIYFTTSDKPVKVLGFGINRDIPYENFTEMAKQIAIYDYQGPDNFIIRLETEGGKDELVLAKIQPQGTLLATYQQIQKRLTKGPKATLSYGERVAIPMMNFKMEHEYVGLQKKFFKNKGFESLQIEEAKQTILFKLNEKGASLESEALVTAKSAHFAEKSIVFDKPYLLYLKEKTAKYPYLVLWINNPEILIKE